MIGNRHAAIQSDQPYFTAFRFRCDVVYIKNNWTLEFKWTKDDMKNEKDIHTSSVVD